MTMKKVLASVLSASMIFALSACGGYSSSSSTTAAASAAAPATQGAAETTAAAPQSGGSANASAKHLKLNHPSADGGPYDLMSKKFAELVEEKSGGKYVIDIFSANALGTQEECLEAVSLGTLDMCVTSDGLLGAYDIQWDYLGLPYVFDDTDDVEENMNGPLGEMLSKTLEPKGMKVISYFENGFRNVTANKEVRVPSDLEGVKIRSATLDGLKALFEGCGAVVTNVSFSELYQALQLGTCEAQENPFPNIIDKKFYEVQKYLCVTMHSHTCEPLIMSMDLFNSLSAEDQAMFMECGLEASRWAYDYSRNTDAENRAFLEGVMTVIDPDKDAWKELAEKTNADLIGRYQECTALKK